MIIAICEETFTKEVLTESTPVLVNFWAPWCGLCRLINPQLNRLIEEWGERVKVVSINADENLKLANTYRLTNLPTLLLFDQGKILHRLEKFHSVDDLHRAFGDLQIALEESTLSCSF
ncbi:MAG: thioredoxin family protein [Elainellaceae cyanobacterium]